MNARDIIKLAAQLYVYDALKKKITILTNIQKGKDINVDIFLPKVTDVTVSDFAKHLQKAIESQPEEERAKHRKFFNESCQALGILVDLNKKRLATCKKCGKTNKECFPTTIEEYDMYIEMLCENCLTEILDKKITAIKPKKIE